MELAFYWELAAPYSEGCDELLAACGEKRAARLRRLGKERLAASLSAQLLCRTAWCAVSGLEPSAFLLEEDGRGKPFVPGSSVFVSLSHSGSYAAAAAAAVPVGIDLQTLRPVSPLLLNRRFSGEERAWIGAAPPESTARAIRLWTMQEAWAKLRGVGIFAGEQFHAAFRGDDLLPEGDGVRFHFPQGPEGCLLTLCLSRFTGETDTDGSFTRCLHLGRTAAE